MESFGFLWQIFAFITMTIFGKLANVADEVLFLIEDYEVYGNTAKLLSSCVGSFYFWQTLATIGFYQYLRRLADRFPRPPIIEIDVGPSMEQLLEGKETALKEAASKINYFDNENAGLRAKVDHLQRDLDSISKDRYTLIKENCILQNKLGDFNSWPEFRIEYEQLATEFEAMKRQRAREHISYEQILHVAKEAKLELASAKRAETIRNIAQSEELKQIQQERDEAKEKYHNLLATTAAAAAANTAATTATAKERTPGDKALQEENTRLTVALRSQTSLLSRKSSELTRMQSLLKTRSDHSANQLTTAASTILSLKKEIRKADGRIAKLEKDVQEANEKAEEMEEMYMAVAFMDEGEGGNDGVDEEKGEDEKEDEGESGEERPATSLLLKQVVAMSKMERDEGGTSRESGANEAGIKEDDDDDDKEDGDEEDEEGEDEKIYNENEDLFKDMMGSP
ncbi:hypothetical protein MMC31_004805 [Peltigera leucophlebia]|nr:hypothetical protein [Peltigera leucophlebia]